MYEETRKSLPVDIAVCTAAISDFKPEMYEEEKIKRKTLNIKFKRNKDILEFLAKNNHQRPKLVIGFAAETNNVLKFAEEKKKIKYCDWIVANDVSDKTIGFDSDDNQVSIFYKDKTSEKLNKMNKSLVASELVNRIIAKLN